MNDDRARDALALAEAALAHALRDGVTEAEALVMAEDSALTRFANSEIHQNVAETNVTINLRVVVGKRVGVASSGRTDDEGLAPPGRARDRHRAGRRGARRLGRPARPDRTSATSPPPSAGRPPRPARSSGRRPSRAVIGAADDAGVDRLRLVRDEPRIDGGRQLEGRPRGRDPHDLAAHHGLDGTRRRDRLRRGGRGRRLDHRRRRRSVARPPTRRARPPTPSRSSPATTRSCSRSTPSSTCSTCSATSASRPSPSRRSAASSSPASGSAATS